MTWYPNLANDATTTRAFLNGRIYTTDEARTWVDAIVVEAGVITFAGSSSVARAIVGDAADTIDLGGRMVLPGLHDAHVHLLFSGRKYRRETRLTPGASRDVLLNELVQANPPGLIDDRGNDWIIAGEYTPDRMGHEGLTVEILDELFPDRPIFVHDYSLHGGVANSKALALAGLDTTTEQPMQGSIVRDRHTGALTGQLVEKAKWPLMRAIPSYGLESDVEAVQWALDVCHQFGITSLQEASATPAALDALRAIDRAGDLRMHVAAHLVWLDEGIGMTSQEKLDDTIARRSEWQSPKLDTQRVKVWLDGAPLPPHMTEAGLSRDGTVETHKLHVTPEVLTAGLQQFDSDGLSVKIHCAGAGAVRVALDAIEQVRSLHPKSEVVHEIAHCTTVHQDDLARFAQLRVTAEMSPAIWHDPRFGLQSAYRFRSLANWGVTMVYGSDWKITKAPNPFPGLQGMLQHGDESLSLPEAIELLTINGARQVGREATHGSLEVGKSADFVVLDRNIFEVDISEVGATKVCATYIDGESVYFAPELHDGPL
ncbi:amidohydrolase [Rhodococcus sp. BP-252]|uniref:amidohydrolase n=1 Tax=unclassified Rhodococcus (in: high G+C Gram-positive bacteria) TaxID=192944 RepID=UPI001C9A656C|nr:MULTISPECIES: amidohydrolase [unclassified Rhodococcus (in: high G+C Gram-positive bacteria)]MBY6412855.1 amidohydrolase [Rhodococcus sp. BP-320]MBY6417608.1 amidohydrolase [Rhodococcus sp. BP-321]MBY6423460.1 amidohydrolase [Rhodococcus sp. BP-324]MBY6427632.1 amidohydrolase [Rhodococcus sp. BP-323]MBY6432796.1 amidohydrolase [Rhodococcus sp. BP-322]